jgi:hypothetical protein
MKPKVGEGGIYLGRQNRFKMHLKYPIQYSNLFQDWRMVLEENRKVG